MVIATNDSVVVTPEGEFYEVEKGQELPEGRVLDEDLPEAKKEPEETSDENIEEGTPVGKETDNPDIETLDDSRVEEMAKTQGWIPKEEFKSDTKKPVDARTFLRKGKHLEKNKSELVQDLSDMEAKLSEKTKAMDTKISDLYSLTKKLSAAQKDQYAKDLAKEIGKLTQERNQVLIDEGDEEKAAAIDEKILDLAREEAAPTQAEESHPIAVPPNHETSKEYDGFYARNTWYRDENPKEANFVRAYAQRLANSEPELATLQHEFWENVEKKVKATFPDRFKTEEEKDAKPKQKAPFVQGGDDAEQVSISGTGGSYPQHEKLDNNIRAVIENFAETKEERAAYIKMLVDNGTLSKDGTFA